MSAATRPGGAATRWLRAPGLRTRVRCMYRDDVCAVCGVSLPPDHFYCREHGSEVDARLHELGERLEALARDLPRLARLLDEIAPETWDWLADEASSDDDLVWPPSPAMTLHVHADEVEVDVDTEPGRVRIDLTCELATVVRALAAGLDAAQAHQLAAACRGVEGANATH